MAAVRYHGIIMASSWYHGQPAGQDRSSQRARRLLQQEVSSSFEGKRKQFSLSLSLYIYIYIYIYIHNSEFRYCYAIIATVTTCFIAHRTCVNELADAGVQLAVVRIYLLGSYGYVGVLNIVCAVRDALLADVDIALPALPAGFMSSL